MAREIEHLERAVARRDRVIDKLHAELEEKDSISNFTIHLLVFLFDSRTCFVHYLMSLFPTGSLLPGL